MRKLLLVLFIPFFLPRPASAQDLSAPEIYQQTLRSTGWVYGPRLNGTGWIVDRERKLIVTNRHIAENAATAFVIFPMYKDGRVLAESGHYRNKECRIAGAVIHREANRDLALIELESLPDGVDEVKLAAASPAVGSRVHIIGNEGAAGCVFTYAPGKVASLRRMKQKVGGVAIDCRVIDLLAPFVAGDSGGPVVNERGELVAILSATGNAGWVREKMGGFSIDVNEIKSFVAEGSKKCKHPDPSEARVHLEQGLTLARMGEWDKALPELNDAIRLNPKNARALQVRGQVFAATEENVNALADFSETIRLEPNDARTYRLRAKLYDKLGDKDKAQADRQTLAKLVPVSLGLSAANIAVDTVKNVAWVRTDGAGGTGCLVEGPKKLVITSASLVGDSKTVDVFFPDFADGKLISDRDHYLKNVKPIVGRVVFKEVRSDLAVLALESSPEGLSGVKLADGGAFQGETVHVLGHSKSRPLWQDRLGVARNIYRRKGTYKDVEFDARVVLVDASLKDGEAGCPVVNERGELVGMISLRATTAPALACSVDISEIKDVLARASK